MLDTVGLVEGYLKQSDWRSKENSNQVYSFSSVFLQAAGEVMKYYTLSRVYSSEVAKAHMSSDSFMCMGTMGYYRPVQNWHKGKREE